MPWQRIGPVERRGRIYVAACRCTCGKEAVVCVRSKDPGEPIPHECNDCAKGWRTRTHGHTLGHRPTPTWRSWDSMRGRCERPGASNFTRYGGRGIKVCERWRTFENFLADMGERPAGTTLERIDNEGNYEPGNCRWATMHEQSRNKSNSRMYEFGGEQLCLPDWSMKTGIGLVTLRLRLQRGWSLERALTTPARAYGNR